MRTPTAWHQHGTNMAPTWQQPINAEAKKQLSKLFNQDAFNQIFKDGKHEQSNIDRTTAKLVNKPRC